MPNIAATEFSFTPAFTSINTPTIIGEVIPFVSILWIIGYIAMFNLIVKAILMIDVTTVVTFVVVIALVIKIITD